MTTVSFPDWKEALAGSALPPKLHKSFEISIQWFLGHLSKRKQPASVESARAFVSELIIERKPADWMVEQWREALNWFFRHAPRRRHRSEAAEATGDGRRHYPVTVREYQDAVPQEPWIEETVRLLRVRHRAYRTEESYPQPFTGLAEAI